MLVPVNVPVGTAQWADEIGSRMTMMVEQGKHTASLRLSPEHLGPARSTDHDEWRSSVGAVRRRACRYPQRHRKRAASSA